MKFTNEFCIVNYASGIYKKGQKRLKDSLISNGYTGDFLFFTEENGELIPSQDESPWGFKPVLLNYAKEKGYKYILWLDSNMICIRKPVTIFKKIIKDGYYISSSYTTKMGYWCSDIALENFGIDRETSFKITEVNPSYVGINTQNSIAVSLLNEWNKYALDGITFRGIPQNYPLSETNKNDKGIVSKDSRVKGHRHDQTAISFLIWKYRLKISYMETKNIQSLTATKENKYSKAIPLTTEIVQNRDIKFEDYYKTYNKWGNNKGLKKINFIILSFIDTVRFAIKGIIYKLK